jgi:hypothetical protein
MFNSIAAAVAICVYNSWALMCCVDQRALSFLTADNNRACCVEDQTSPFMLASTSDASTQRRAASRYLEPLLEVRAVPADAVLTWRRSVYERGLWAVPLAAEPAAASDRSGGAAAGVGRERRLEDWVGRELRALFQSDVSPFLHVSL